MNRYKVEIRETIIVEAETEEDAVDQAHEQIWGAYGVEVLEENIKEED